MTDSTGMKLLAMLLFGSALMLGAVWSAEVVEARIQTVDDGLAIHGTVMVVGSREPFSGVAVELKQNVSGLFRELIEAGLSVEDASAAQFSQKELVKTATTDVQGRFGFTALSPGRYDLTFTAPGMTRPFQRLRRSIVLTEGTAWPDLKAWISQDSVVSGRVLGPDRQPVPEALVEMDEVVWERGRRSLSDVTVSGRTNEEGFYQVLVPPGVYYVDVRPLDRLSFLRFYYPGVPIPGDAVPITVARGVDRSGIDVTLRETDLFRVRFRLLSPEIVPGVPEPLDTYLDDDVAVIEGEIRPVEFGLTNSEPYWFAFERSEEEDVWMTPPLPAGIYDLMLVYPANLENALRKALDWEVSDTRWNHLQPIARLRFTVEDGDLDLGTIAPVAKTDLPGRVIVRGSSPKDIDLADLPSLDFYDPHFLRPGSRHAVIESDGAFVVRELHAGLFKLGFDAEALPGSWYVASAMSGTRDVLRDGLEVGGQVSPLEIVLADDAAEIGGAIRDSGGMFVPASRVVLVPPINRRGPFATFPTVEADDRGIYALEKIPPGDYTLLALDVAGLPDSHRYWEDPEFLREYALRGERITVGPGARITIDLKAVPIYE